MTATLRNVQAAGVPLHPSRRFIVAGEVRYAKPAPVVVTDFDLLHCCSTDTHTHTPFSSNNRDVFPHTAAVINSWSGSDGLTKAFYYGPPSSRVTFRC